MLLSYLWLFPVSIAILLPGTFVITYCLAIWYGHAQPIWPYISDTGSYPPESCIFAQLLNIIAVLAGIVMYLRHRQIVEFFRHSRQSRRRFIRASKIFLWVAYLSAFGLSMVGNFQQTNWHLAHKIGAASTFGFGLLYCWAQTVFTYQMQPVMHWRWVSHVRLVLTMMATMCCLTMGGVAFGKYLPIRKNITVSVCTPWNEWSIIFIESTEKGYYYHLIVTVCEWVMSFAYVAYFVTYAIELRYAALIPPKMKLTVEHDKLPRDSEFECTSIADVGIADSPELLTRREPTGTPETVDRSISAMLGNLWVFPVAVSIILPTTFFLTYCLAVWYQHAQPIFPYISDTGSYPPESCLFGQLLNVAALIVGLVMYFRHRQIAEFHRHAKQSRRSFLYVSTVFLWVGYASAFGLSMVGNFQQTNWLSAHMLGAVMAFGLGLIYCWAQTVFSYKMETVMHWPWVSHFRLGLSISATICFLLMGTFGFNPFYDSAPSRMNDTVIACMPGAWQLIFVRPGEKGYASHLVTTICEWLMSFAFMLYFTTYAVELRHAALVPAKLMLTIDHDKLPRDAGYTTCPSLLEELKMKKSAEAVKSGSPVATTSNDVVPNTGAESAKQLPVEKVVSEEPRSVKRSVPKKVLSKSEVKGNI